MDYGDSTSTASTSNTGTTNIQCCHFQIGMDQLNSHFHTTLDRASISLDCLRNVVGKGSKRGMSSRYWPQLTTLLIRDGTRIYENTLMVARDSVREHSNGCQGFGTGTL
jgi:hypothetical protein